MAAAIGINPTLTEQIRTLTQTKRIRVTEFFQDYDKLRSGFVTGTQFFRCLWQTMNLKLSPEDEQALINRYDLRHDGTVNYRRFCEDINLNFKPNVLDVDPNTQKVEPQELLGTARSVRPLTCANEETLVKLLKRMQHYYSVHGLNLRTNYEDFDIHHLGVVTDSQFYRNFPGPSDTCTEEMRLLVDKYRDPSRPGYINYLNLHHDIMAVTDFLKEDAKVPTIPQTFIDQVPLLKPHEPPVNQILDKLKLAIFKNGIRSLDFFRDRDKLRSGAVTENQFWACLVLCAEKEAQLTQSEIQKLVNFYRQPDGRIRYRELCELLENAFTVGDLEKKPTDEVVRPTRGSLFRGLQPLPSEEAEAQLRRVLEELSEKCRRQRIDMYPYFKDYDRSQLYSRVVTPLQFGRILHFLGLNVCSQDMQLLLTKFKDPTTGDVNYPAFVQAVDPEFVANTEEDVGRYDESSYMTNDRWSVHASFPETEVPLEDLMVRIRHLVLTNRLRVLDFFQDFDHLRSGRMSKSRFRRCLASMSLSKLGQHDLNNKQFDMLAKAYENPNNPDEVIYTKFVSDVESVFTQTDLEHHPTQLVPPQEIYRAPKPGTVDWSKADPNHVALFEATMTRLKARMNHRRILIKPFFRDFDKNNNGHVSRVQFRQAMTMLDIPLTATEMAALEARYYNDSGVNYMAFLEELDPSEPQEHMYVKRLEEVRDYNAAISAVPEMNPETDTENILLKIKTKVCQERIRIQDFIRDYDKLNSGRVPNTTFRRAIKLARLDLCESELATLEDRYAAGGFADHIDYRRLCEEVESIFSTPHMEKMPLEEPEQFSVPEQWQLNHLTEEENEKLIRCMTKIKEKVRKERMQLFPLFEDFDKVHVGSVSAQQFRRVLTELRLESLVGHEEFLLLCKRFKVKLGNLDNINYLAFSEMIYHMAGFEWRKP